MDSTPPIITGKKDSGADDSPHKHATGAVCAIAGCACATFIVGAVLGEAWPAAVVACALALMGVCVAGIMLRRP